MENFFNYFNNNINGLSIIVIFCSILILISNVSFLKNKLSGSTILAFKSNFIYFALVLLINTFTSFIPNNYISLIVVILGSYGFYEIVKILLKEKIA
jgi:hypothetical protein